ncbi:hypothetical protein [Candidatus Hepatoplasma crinochetorum]|uniref:hypothetical protein n=1 Tax=Candidatus Hepatoplasma crinochetorum TaxID=295596 RepID=UPI00309101A9|nr:MAG: hypothetical protein HCTKY_1320 [Candidatus Hepatoplasma crinochetorum]
MENKTENFTKVLSVINNYNFKNEKNKKLVNESFEKVIKNLEKFAYENEEKQEVNFENIKKMMLKFINGFLNNFMEEKLKNEHLNDYKNLNSIPEKINFLAQNQYFGYDSEINEGLYYLFVKGSSNNKDVAKKLVLINSIYHIFNLLCWFFNINSKKAKKELNLSKYFKAEK